MLSKKKEYIFCFLFGAYIAAVLWITLLSDEDVEYVIENFKEVVGEYL